MSVNISTTSPYVMQQNTCELLIILQGSSEIFLPSISSQLLTIKFVNLGNVAVQIKYNQDEGGALFYTLQNQNFVEIYPNRISTPIVWLIFGSGQTGGLGTSWETSGNALNSIGLLGSVNAEIVRIIRNSIPQIDFLNTGVTYQTDVDFNNQFLVNCKDPSAATDVANRKYVDDSIVNAPRQFSVLIGSKVDQTSISDTTITTTALPDQVLVVIHLFTTNFTVYYATSQIMIATVSGLNSYAFKPYTGNTGQTGTFTINNVNTGATTLNIQGITLTSVTGWSMFIYA